jgi:hypothetical protein
LPAPLAVRIKIALVRRKDGIDAAGPHASLQ